MLFNEIELIYRSQDNAEDDFSVEFTRAKVSQAIVAACSLAESAACRSVEVKEVKNIAGEYGETLVSIKN